MNKTENKIVSVNDINFSNNNNFLEAKSGRKAEATFFSSWK